MWERFGKPVVGYTLADYRAVTEAVAGESLEWYYDLCIFGNQPLEPKLNEYLAWVGLQIIYEEPRFDQPGGIQLLELDDELSWLQRAKWLGSLPVVKPDQELIFDKTLGERSGELSDKN
jgi:predicted metalloprotease with PDZ domain